MNAARRKRKTGARSPFSPVALLLQPGAGRQAIVILVMIAGMTGGAVYAWQRWGDRITEGPEYVLLPENFEIPAKPAWIRSDIRAEVVRDGSLTDMSIRDTQLLEKVKQAFAMHSWVERVTRVSKYYPARVVVEMAYRKPVAMVEVSVNGQAGLFPIDIEGVLLPPADFITEDGAAAGNAREYLRIFVPDAAPTGPVGTAWGDPRVDGAARIAAVFQDRWKDLGLYRIAIGAPESAAVADLQPTYELLTKNGFRVIWGKAPDADSAAEAKAALAKVAKLATYVQSNGSLESITGTTHIDLRGRPDFDPHTATLPTGPSGGPTATNR